MFSDGHLFDEKPMIGVVISGFGTFVIIKWKSETEGSRFDCKRV